MPIALFTATTDDNGYYQLPLQAGNYQTYASTDMLSSKTMYLQINQDTSQDYYLAEMSVTPM